MCYYTQKNTHTLTMTHFLIKLAEIPAAYPPGTPQHGTASLSSWPTHLACLLLRYVLATSKVTSGVAPTCDSVYSWRLNNAAPLENQVTSNMTWYPTKLHYPDTASTSHCPILIMLTTQLGSDKYHLNLTARESIRLFCLFICLCFHVVAVCKVKSRWVLTVSVTGHVHAYFIVLGTGKQGSPGPGPDIPLNQIRLSLWKAN